MEDNAIAREDEIALARQAAAGDHEAFGLIVRKYEQRLLAYLTQMLGDAECARDLAQETFLAVFQALPRWKPPDTSTFQKTGPLSPWLYRIATNRALSLLRSRSSRYASDAPLKQHEQLIPSSSLLEERTAARDLLQAALRQLSEEDAACLVLHYVAGERYNEIAGRLGLSGEAVRKRVSRGLIALRAAYHALDVEAHV